MHVPISQRIQRPARFLVRMALSTGIGCTHNNAQIRARNAEAMIAPGVNAHIGGLGHVAVGALCTTGRLLVAVVLNRVILLRFVALGTDTVAGRSQL